MPEYRIKDWDETYENHRTRELARLDWVLMPNKMDGLGYTELVSHENGAAHLGAWVAIVEIASRQTPRDRRGYLPVIKGSTARALARLSRLPESLFEEVLARLVAKEIGWLEEIAESSETSIPQDSGAASREHRAVTAQSRAVVAEERVSVAPRARARNGTEGKGKEISSSSARDLVQALHPGTDAVVVSQIVEAAEEARPGITDDNLRDALKLTHKGKRQLSAALWLRTVPEYLRATAARSPDESPPVCSACADTGKVLNLRITNGGHFNHVPECDWYIPCAECGPEDARKPPGRVDNNVQELRVRTVTAGGGP